MKITIIYGTQRKSKSSTYNIAQLFLERLAMGDQVTEFFLPQAMPNFCRGCWNCFTDYTKCPDYDYLKPIITAIDEAELLIFTAPVYVYHIPGQVKALLDHFAYRWMPHQPSEKMFHKQALLLSTAAGAGMRSTLKDLKDSMTFWGVARTYTYSKAVRASDWDTVDEKIKSSIETEVKKLSEKILKESNHIKPSMKVKGLFYAMRFMQRKFAYNAKDVEHWAKLGWLEKEKPW